MRDTLTVGALHRQLGMLLARADVSGDEPVVVPAGDHQYRFASIRLTTIERNAPHALSPPFCDVGCDGSGVKLHAILVE